MIVEARHLRVADCVYIRGRGEFEVGRISASGLGKVRLWWRTDEPGTDRPADAILDAGRRVEVKRPGDLFGNLDAGGEVEQA